MFQRNTASPVEALVISETINPLTTLLRNKALSSGWPSDISERLYITDSDGALIVHIPDDIKEQTLDLEYGTIDKMPSPVIRPFIYKYAPEVATAAGVASLFDFAMTGGGVF